MRNTTGAISRAGNSPPLFFWVFFCGFRVTQLLDFFVWCFVDHFFVFLSFLFDSHSSIYDLFDIYILFLSISCNCLLCPYWQQDVRTLWIGVSSWWWDSLVIIRLTTLHTVCTVPRLCTLTKCMAVAVKGLVSSIINSPNSCSLLHTCICICCWANIYPGYIKTCMYACLPFRSTWVHPRF